MHNILLSLSLHLIAWFWPVWIALTVVAAFATAWFVGSVAGVPIRHVREVSARFAAGPRFDWSRNARLAVAFFGLYVASHVALIFAWEDFAYYDNSQFTLFTLQGHDYLPPIWPGNGRFFPLDCQEFNLICHISKSIFAYHALPAFELLIVCFILLVLDQELDVTARVLLAVFVLLIPGMVISFGGLIYPERNVILWILCLAIFVKRFDRTQSTTTAVGAILCAQFLLYYKETAFLFLWGFAGVRLLFRCRDFDRPGWYYGRLRARESRLDLCLASAGLFFLVYYGAVMCRHANFDYARNVRLPELKVLLLYSEQDLLMWLFAGVVICRVYLIFCGRIQPLFLWDGLACGAMAYYAGFFLLHMVSDYYLAPADVIAILYTGRLVFLSWEKMRLRTKAAVLSVFLVIFFQFAAQSAYRVWERKNLIIAKADIATLIQSRYDHAKGMRLRLFFPFASPYVTMEFGSYLSYRGIPVEMASDTQNNSDCVELICRSLPKDGLLEDYRPVIGHAGTTPEPGDLVIILPDDNASFTQIAPYHDGGELLSTYEPRPSIPNWSGSVIRRLYYADPIPDHWLNASVTLWDDNNKLRE